MFDVSGETMLKTDFGIAVVGGGPAGYIAAVKAARLGVKTVLIEKSELGGTCLNRGCIPAKSYLKTAGIIEDMRSAAARGIIASGKGIEVDIDRVIACKDGAVKSLTGGVAALLKSCGVTVINGDARIKPDKTIRIGDKSISAGRVILAGGSKAAKLNLPGMDSERVLTSDDIFELREVPKKLAVIGGGVIGVEMAAAFRAFGSEVVIIEAESNILPMMDADVSEAVRKTLGKKGISIHTQKRLERIEEGKDGIDLHIGTQQPVKADYALLSVGRVPDLSAIEGLDVALDRGRIKTDDTMRSSIEWLYAPGDINGRCMLAHAAYKMGEVAAENAAGHEKKADLRYVPSCVYTMPEAGCVGLTEKQARVSYDVNIGRFPFSANGRALASGEGEGFVKVITDKKYGEVLGVHIVGPSASEIINEASALMAMEITVNEIAGIIHGHPTFSEAFMEAAADSLGRSLHLPLKKLSFGIN